MTLWSPLLAVVGSTLATFIHTVETVPATRLRSFGASHMTYKRAYEKIGQRMQEVEALAVARLTPYFEETGLTSGAAECA
ncbi:hypothetical protein GNZ24_31525 [Burkholderia thailandensis]|nr:hypothetical protein [Burkholderia thailandensis]MUV31450.1 hypothetical protein [Burkholderia thailandensis]